MLNVIIAIAGILLTLLLVIGLHEFGHFIAARLLGIKVLRFSIGFGKRLCGWCDKQGTEYVIAALPLGGYVKLLDENETVVASHELHQAFNRQPFYKKLLVVLAGPLTNFLLAIVLYWLIFMMGFVSIVPVTAAPLPHSIAAAAGIPAQHEIIQIDQHATSSWLSIIIRLLAHTGDKDKITMVLKPLNSQTTQRYQLDTQHWQMNPLKPDPLTSLGLQPYVPDDLKWPSPFLRKNQYNPVTALARAWRNTYDFTYLNLLVIGKLFTGKITLQSLSGPLAIFQSAGSALNQGMIPFLSFVAFLSISIGIINIFPIPGLDGGHLLFQTIEAVSGRPIPPRVLEFCYKIGIIIILLLIFQSTINDVLRWR